VLFRAIAALLPLALIAGVEVATRRYAHTAPPDPALRFATSRVPGFSPLADDGKGRVAVRTEWVARDGYRRRTEHGVGHGQYFLFPGFREVGFLHEKPPATLRVFALGDSTTFGLHVGAEAAYPARLAGALQDRHPFRRTEVINLGCPGWASDRLLNLLTSLLQEEPDLFVIYAGQNELLDPATALPAATGPAARLRARMISTSALYGWLDYALRRALEGGSIEEWREEAIRLETERSRAADPLAVLLLQQEQVGDDYRAAAVRAFEANLSAMIERAGAAAVPVVLVMPVANLATPPATVHGIAGGSCEPLLAAARDAAGSGRHREAAALYARCAEDHPEDAALHYLLGMELEGLGRHDEALGELVRAADLDVETTRITSPFEQVLVRVAGRTGVPLVDLRPDFRRDLRRPAADALFIDHCHPTEKGHRLIAVRTFPPVERQLARKAGPTAPWARPMVKSRRKGFLQRGWPPRAPVARGMPHPG